MIKFQLRKSTHDRVAASRVRDRSAGIHRREVVLMTAADIILIFIGIIGLIISFGSLIVALLAFLDKRNKQKNNAHPVGKQDGRLSLRGK